MTADTPDISTNKPEADRVVARSEVRSRGAGVNPKDSCWQPTHSITSEVKRFFTAVMFLTRLPVPHWVDHDPKFLVPGMMWFPFVGAGVGVWAAVWFAALCPILSSLPAAACSTAATVWLTGCFHEDGFADCLDGFGGGWSKEQILRIMKDSRVGTYAVVGTSLHVVTKVAVLAAIQDRGTFSAASSLMVGHALCRWVALILTYGCHYLSDDEDDKGLLYNTFSGCLKQGLLSGTRILSATVFIITWALVLLPWPTALLCLATVCLGAIVSARYAYSVLGGVMGDYLGATTLVMELVVYLALIVDWSQFVVPNAAYCLAQFELHSCQWGPWPAICRLLVVVLPVVIYMKGAGALVEEKTD